MSHAISPMQPEKDEKAEKDEIQDERHTTASHVENAPGSQAISEYDEDSEDFEFTLGKFLACLSFMVGIFSDVFTLSLGSSIITTVNRDLGPDPNYTWFINAQVVSSAVLAPMVGRLSDIFGRRNFFIIGNVITVLGSALTAKSTTLDMAIAGTTLIGCASAMHQISFAAISEVVPKRIRPMTQGIFQMVLGTAGGVAPLIGYALIKYSTWRLAYWISFALNGAGLVLVVLFYHPQNQYILEEGKTKLGQLKSLDYTGLLLFTAGLVLFLMGLSFGGVKYPWASAGTLAPMLVGIALLIVTFFWEMKSKSPYALFPRAIMADIRGFTVVVGVVFLMGMLYYSTAVLWPQQVQVLYATDPIIIGAYSSASTLASVPFTLFLGIFFQRYARHGRWIFTSWVALVTIICGCQAVVTPGSMIASTILVGLSGIFVSAGTVASTSMAQLGVPHEFIGIASLMLVTARTVGGSVATTVYTVILQNNIKDHGAKKVALAMAEGGVPLTSLLPVVTALLGGDQTDPALEAASVAHPQAILAGVAALKQAYAHAFRIVYLVSIAFGTLGTICAAFSLNVDKRLTRHVDVTLDEGAHLRTHEGNRKAYVIHRHK